MMVRIPQVINRDQLAIVRQLIKDAPFVDGKLSAGIAAQPIKNNLELDKKPELVDRLNNVVMTSLYKNPQYQSVALPSKIGSPFYAKYVNGMNYGWHVDNAVMGPINGMYRSDVSTTVFLSDPDEYEGGELIIRTTYGEDEIKLPAGFAVVYPSTSLHKVAEVTSGERLVAVTWAQSIIRDDNQRELLYELNLVREKWIHQHSNEDDTSKLDSVYNNLVRMWGEV